MFGKNALLRPIRDLAQTGGRYWVQDVFPTIQGEGPLAGTPAVFVRLAGCNLRCHFCDTDFESSTWNPTPEELLYRILAVGEAAGHWGARLVVFTGGEPLRQPLGAIVDRLVEDYTIQVETAGTLWDHSLDPYQKLIHWVCSPKTGTVDRHMTVVCRDYKYIVRAGDSDPIDGLPMLSTQEPGREAKIFRPSRANNQIWVQPCEEYESADGRSAYERNKANIDHAVALCMRHGYRLSLQTHKMIGLP